MSVPGSFDAPTFTLVTRDAARTFWIDPQAKANSVAVSMTEGLVSLFMILMFDVKDGGTLAFMAERRVLPPHTGAQLQR
jgi:hypothetical protein